MQRRYEGLRKSDNGLREGRAYRNRSSYKVLTVESVKNFTYNDFSTGMLLCNIPSASYGAIGNTVTRWNHAYYMTRTTAKIGHQSIERGTFTET